MGEQTGAEHAGAAGQVVAHSPIAPAPPVGVVAGWVVSLARSAAPLTLADRTPLAKVAVQGRPGSAGVPAVAFGRAARQPDGTLVVGYGPREWLLLGTPGTAAALAAAWCRPDDGGRATDGLCTVTDVTSGRALLRLTGRQATDLLAKVCALDLARAPDGSVARSSVAKVAAVLVRDDVTGPAGPVTSYLIGCDRSVGGYLHGALLDAGAEFGLEPTGFASPS